MLAASLAPAADLPGANLKDFAGTWVMRLGDRNLFVLTLIPEGNGVRGSFARPEKFFSTNSLFVGMRGGVRHDSIVRSHFADGVLHLTIRNAHDAKDEDTWTMSLRQNRAELVLEGLPAGVVVEPYPFTRAAGNAQVATDWEPNRAYTAADSDIPNAEMKAIFDEDQRVRTSGPVDWQAVNGTDAARRVRVHQLLAAGALHTGSDFYEAAMVFQHGDSPPDYLLAHTLAMIAMSKGNAAGAWIAAATLDRYLQKSGQKQIFGTQFLTDPAMNWTQEPYDRRFLSDELREQLGVPPQALQAEQLKTYQAGK